MRWGGGWGVRSSRSRGGGWAGRGWTAGGLIIGGYLGADGGRLAGRRGEAGGQVRRASGGGGLWGFKGLVELYSSLYNKKTQGPHYPLKVKARIDIPTYDGIVDAEKLYSWVDQLETYFTLYGFSRSDKVVFAWLKLTSHALAWWNSQLKTRGEDVSWKEFTRLLRQEFNQWGILKTVGHSGIIYVNNEGKR
ncbi:hypothetical protein Tco_0766879 [Tanacetum coccineum]